MERRMNYQDHPSRFFLIIARIIGFLITGVFLLFMVPEFIEILDTKSEYTELWIFVFYALAMLYGTGFLLSFWKIKIGGYIMVLCSVAIALYGFLDTMSWAVFLILIPLSFSGILFLIYAKKLKL
ncbi:hypothetical protein [Marinifilum caeruleilacunae]|uniref:DUF4064 domain-containing protein n=1 Tax=Marinifilum caeruleilacunae TaxID=2499076 RepID=A0ABX1WSS3_9BACT|nr:hypothetical protein [Marinifilum caeruleilacunae]NOU59159.1 hypothetical protein [Marinifilum caeruleilacunae]